MIKRTIYGSLLLLVALATCPAQAADFARVVALGDSLQDTTPNRGPVVSAHIAQRLGATFTNLALGGSTSASLIAEGRHTEAAARFGNGDLAVLWIGGNDFLEALDTGDVTFIDRLEENVDVILSALRAAGMDVVTLNLPDMSLLPATIALEVEIREALYALSVDWRNRLDALGHRHGVAVVDVFSTINTVRDRPAEFSVDGISPVLSPEAGERDRCSHCFWVDGIHPSALGQSYLANAALIAMNAFFDPAGREQLPLISETEQASLIDQAAYVRVSGFWFTPQFPGEGLSIIESTAGATIYYNGKDADGEALWLVSDTLPGRFAAGQSRHFAMFAVDGEGTFSVPLPSVDLIPWGLLNLRFEGCNSGALSMQGNAGTKSQSIARLASPLGGGCVLP